MNPDYSSAGTRLGGAGRESFFSGKRRDEMERKAMRKGNVLSVICISLIAAVLYLPSICQATEYELEIDVSPNIVNIASERGGDIRLFTRLGYSTYITDGAAVFVYFNDSESVTDIITTRDSLGNLILKFGLDDLLAVGDSLVPDGYNDVKVVIVMKNGDEYIGEDQVYLVDKNLP